MSNDSGDVHVCDLDGEVQRSLKLPYGAKCIIADEHWIYAGTNKGVVYDRTGNSPRAVYQVDSSAEILWLDIYQGNLCVAADNGTLSVYDPGEVLLWQHKSKHENSQWMVRADKDGVYAGGSASVRAFDWGGELRWNQPMISVMFGVQTADAVYAANDSGGTGFTKAGKPLSGVQGLVVAIMRYVPRRLAKHLLVEHHPPRAARPCVASVERREARAIEFAREALGRRGQRTHGQRRPAVPGQHRLGLLRDASEHVPRDEHDGHACHDRQWKSSKSTRVDRGGICVGRAQRERRTGQQCRERAQE